MKMSKVLAREIISNHEGTCTIKGISAGMLYAKLEVGRNENLDGLNVSDMCIIEAALVLAGFKFD